MSISTLRRLALKGVVVCATAAAISTSSHVFADEAILRVSAIPDEAPTELQRKFAPLGKYLEAQTGMKVVFTPVSDYAAVVESGWAASPSFRPASAPTGQPSLSSSVRRMPVLPPNSLPQTPISNR